MPDAVYIDPQSNRRYRLETPRWRGDDGAPLLVSPSAGLAPEDIERGMRSLWRYRAAMPMAIGDPITLGEGCTPLLAQKFNGRRALFKCEWVGPSGSYKDRGMSVMLSYLRQQGVDAVLEDSSGNAGASIAAYGAAGGMAVKVLAPASASPGKLAQAEAYGAEVQRIEGPREACTAEAIRQSAEIFYASHNWQPMFIEGVKTLAYELWEDLGFRAPAAVITPVGAGGVLLGLHFGFKELKQAGRIARLPQLFAAQPLNCSPVAASFDAGADGPFPRAVRPTLAEGTAIVAPLRLDAILAALRESGGAAVAASEAAIYAAWRALAAQGLYAEPTSATAAAVFQQLAKAGRLPDGDVVVVLTGSGLKTGPVPPPVQ